MDMLNEFDLIILQWLVFIGLRNASEIREGNLCND